MMLKKNNRYVHLCHKSVLLKFDQILHNVLNFSQDADGITPSSSHFYQFLSKQR